MEDKGKSIKFQVVGCQKWKPVAFILIIYFVMAVLNLLFKKILDEGKSHLVIVTYRLTTAAIFLMPIAYFHERGLNVKLTAPILCYLFVSALFGATLSQYLFLLGIQCTSAAFATAFANLTPVFTFLLAIVLGQESVNFKSIGKIAKLLGSLICFGGVLILIFYRGIPLSRATYSRTTLSNANINNFSMFAKIDSKHQWILGSIFLVLSSLCWSGWFHIQSRIGKRYPCKYMSTALMSAFGAIQSAILCFAINRNMSVWIFTGKLQIFTVLSAGVFGSGLCYVGISWCVEQRGPVFTTAFVPSVQIYIAIMDLAFFHEQIYLGSVIGSILVICGLYTLLWGKSREESQENLTKPAEAVQCNDSSATAIDIIHVSNSGCPS